MTVTNTNTQQAFTGDGVTTAFNFNFPIQLSTDVVVYINNVLQNSGYSVSVNNPTAGLPITGSTGGTVTFSVAPANAASILVARNVPYTEFLPKVVF